MSKTVTPALPPHVQAKQWIVEGQTFAAITESITNYWPHLKPAEVMEAAVAELETDGTVENMLPVRGFVLNGFREIYRRALEIGDFSNAIAALKQINAVSKDA